MMRKVILKQIIAEIITKKDLIRMMMMMAKTIVRTMRMTLWTSLKANNVALQKNRRQPKEKAPSKTNVTDLRVQLYKKRQKMQQQQKQAEPEMQEDQPEVDQEYPKTKFREIEPELDDYDDDRDSLEKAQLSSSEEEEFTHRNIQITSTNRIVKKPSKSPPKPKKRLIKEEMPLKKSAIRPTLMSRLGGKVPSEDEYSEEEEDLATSPPLRFKSKASKSSDENSE